MKSDARFPLWAAACARRVHVRLSPSSTAGSPFRPQSCRAPSLRRGVFRPASHYLDGMGGGLFFYCAAGAVHPILRLP